MTYYERNLPHWHPTFRWIFVTWRLHGSLPLDVVERLRSSECDAGERFARAERLLDGAKTGPLWLSNSQVAKIVVQCVSHGALALRFCTLIAYVVMLNHVHLLIDPQVPMKRITAGIKGVSARDANRVLGRTGQTFWQAESFDHWVRDTAEGAKIKDYVQQNPVKAGLVGSAEQWPWSSAAKPSL